MMTCGPAAGLPGGGEFRITVWAALAWRAMTEIVRRRHVTHRFDLLQVHPGTSVAGLIQLHLQGRADDSGLRIDFNLGGPHAGWWETPDGVRGPLLNLLGREPVAAVDAIECAAGLAPWRGHVLPPSSPAVRAVRRVAAELERRVFQPLPWRTTAGFVGWQEDIVCDWHRHFITPVGPCEAGFIRRQDRERLSSLVLIHEAPDDGCAFYQSALQGEGLVIDLASGKVARMNAFRVIPE